MARVKIYTDDYLLDLAERVDNEKFEGNFDIGFYFNRLKVGIRIIFISISTLTIRQIRGLERIMIIEIELDLVTKKLFFFQVTNIITN